MEKIKAIIEKEIANGRYVFARYSNDIENDFRRGWSAWMGTWFNRVGDVFTVLDNIALGELCDALDITREDIEEAGGCEPGDACAVSTEEIARFWMNKNRRSVKDLLRELTDYGVIGYDEKYKSYAVIDTRGGRGLSAYIVYDYDDMPDTSAIPSGDGVKAKGNYKLLASLGNNWYLFSADDYIPE